MKTPRIITFLLILSAWVCVPQLASAQSATKLQGADADVETRKKRKPTLKADLLMKNNRIYRNVQILYRKPGTSRIFVYGNDKQDKPTPISVRDIEEINFDMSAFNIKQPTPKDQRPLPPITPYKLYEDREYTRILKHFGKRLVPYYGFMDVNANSNDYISLFNRSLYFSKAYETTVQSCQEIQKKISAGPIYTEAIVYETLAYQQLGQTNKFEEARGKLPELSRDDTYGAPRLAIDVYHHLNNSNDWTSAYIPLARMITERPLDLDWSGQALYWSAEYHKSVTNLVVANQIIKELTVVDPNGVLTPKALEMGEEIAKLATELGVDLTVKVSSAGRGGSKGANTGEFEAAVDYESRKRQLERESRGGGNADNDPVDDAGAADPAPDGADIPEADDAP